MTEKNRAGSVAHDHDALASVTVDRSAGRRIRKVITLGVLCAFINLDVLYPMQQAFAAERRTQADTAERNAHSDALGDALALAGYREQAKASAQSADAAMPSLAMSGKAAATDLEAAPVDRVASSAQDVRAGTARVATAGRNASNRQSTAAPAAPTAGGTQAPSLFEAGSQAGGTVDKMSTSMPTTLADNSGTSFSIMPKSRAVLFGAAGQEPSSIKSDGAARETGAMASGASKAKTRTRTGTTAKAMATATAGSGSDYVAPGGTAGADGVDPTTGKLGFSIPLAAVTGFSLGVEYSNAQVKHLADTWNYDAPTGDAGLGWGAPSAHMRILRAPGRTGAAWNDSFLLDTGSTVYKLKLVQTGADGIMYYDAGSGSMSRIERHASYWLITDTAGVKYYFGDSYRSSDNTASESGTSEYQAVCTALKAWMAAAASSADSCAFGATETAVRWGTWQGPMTAAGTSGNNVTTFSTAWDLSAIEGLSGKRTTLFYLQHMQPVNSSTGPAFTKASYLYKVETDNNEQLIVGWSNKLPREIPDPKTANAEPDAFQEKMQVLYIASAATSSNGTPVGKMTLDYNGGVLLNDDDTSYMGKRILTGVNPSLYDQDAKAYIALPGWQFSYWGQSTYDGVAVSRWNNDNASTSANGAQYGMLKTAIGPSGKTASYAYKQQTTIAGKALTVTASTLGITSDRHARFGPGYVMVGGTATNSKGKTVHQLGLYTWTSTGWKAQLTQASTGYFGGSGAKDEAGTPTAWDISSPVVQWSATGEGMAAVLLPNSTNNNDHSTIGGVCSDLYLLYQNADNPDQWLSKKLNTYDTQICGWASVAVGSGKVAVAATGLQSSGTISVAKFTNPIWQLWSSDDWSYVNDVQGTSDAIDEVYGAKFYEDSFSNPINGTVASASAQIGAGFVAFYLTGKDNSARTTSLQTVQTYTTEFLFFDEAGMQGTYGVPAKTTKSTTLTVNSFIYDEASSKPVVLPEYLVLGQPIGASPDLAMWITWDQQAKGGSGNYCGSGKVYCLTPVNNASFLLRTNQRNFFTEPDGTQSPYGANPADPGAYIKPVDNSGALMQADTYTLKTSGYSATASSSALLSSGVMDLGVQALTAVSSSLAKYYVKEDCTSSLAGPAGYTTVSSIDPKTCLSFYTDGTANTTADANGVLAADVDWMVTNPEKSDGQSTLQHLLHDPQGNGIKAVASGMSTFYTAPPYNAPAEQNLSGESPGSIDSIASGLIGPAAQGALVASGALSQGDLATAGLVAGVGLGLDTREMFFGGGQSGADLATEQVNARSGMLGNRVFYGNAQAEIRNADDSFSLTPLYLSAAYGQPWTLPMGSARTFIPMTFASGDTVTVAHIGIKNGDLRRSGNSAASDPDWESMITPTTTSSSVSPWVTEQSTVAYSVQNTHNDVDSLSSPWAFISYKSTNKANFRDAAGDFTLYAFIDGKATGALTDTVVAGVATSDGMQPTVHGYTYYNDADKSSVARVKSGGSGVYGLVEITLTGVQAVNLMMTDPNGQKACLGIGSGNAILISEVNGNDCTNGEYQAPSYGWYLQADGRVTSVANPGQCLQADTSASSGLVLAACNPAQPLQQFAGMASSKKVFTLGLSQTNGSNDCLNIHVDDDSGYGTGGWNDPETASCSTITMIAVPSASGAAGKVAIYSYSGNESTGPTVASQPDVGGYLQYAGPQRTDNLVNSTLVAAPWITYQSSLLGLPYKTEQYRQGATTPYSSSSTTYQIEYSFSNSNSVATQSLDRNVSVAGASSTNDGVTVSESYDYNAIGQLRAVHQATQQLNTSVGSSGTISSATQTRRQSSYVFYAWEVPDYAAAMLANNQYAPVYLSYATLGTGTAMPKASGANAVTYTPATRADGSSIMLPSASYTARGNSVGIPNQVRFGLNTVILGTSGLQQASWTCLEYATSNNQLYRNTMCGSPAVPTGVYGTSLYNLARLPDQDNSGSYGNYVRQNAWMISPSTASDYCLQAVAGASMPLTGAKCDSSNTLQVFYLQERMFEGYGYVSELRSQGLNQCMYGLPYTGGNANLGGWTTCFGDDSIPGSKPAGAILSAIIPAAPMVMRALDPATSQWTCLQASGTGSANMSSTDCATAPSATQQFVLHAANGVLELADGSGRCLFADTFDDNDIYLDGCTYLNEYNGDGVFLAASTLVPALGNTATRGLSALQAGYTGTFIDEGDSVYGGKCLVSGGSYGSCSGTSVLGFNPQPTGAPQGMIAPSALGNSTSWIAGASVLVRDTASLAPTAAAAYLGTDAASGQPMSVSSSTLLSKDGRSLPIALFGLARADKSEAGYIGFESYEYTGSFNCSGTNGWTCSGGALTTSGAHAGNAAYGGGSATTLTFADPVQAADYTGNPLRYIASAWVKPANGATCALGINTKKGWFGTTSSTGDGSDWFYVEAITTGTAAIDSGSLQVICAGGGYIDDVAFRPVNGGFSAVVYDSTRQYQPIATLGDGSLVGRIVLNEFGVPYFGYARRTDSSHSQSGFLTSGFAVGGSSRLNGFGLPNGSATIAPMYVPSIPNSAVAIGMAPEGGTVCNNINGRIATGCGQLTGSGMAMEGKSFVIRGKFAYTGDADASGTASIGYSYGSLYAPTLTFKWASATQDTARPNGNFVLTDKDGNIQVQTDTLQWPRDLAMVAMRDAVLLFGDGKLLLSHEGSSGAIGDDFDTDSVIKLTGMSITNAVVGGTPSVAIGYANAAGQSLQSHALQTAGTDTGASLIDVAAATLYDAWGAAAVQTLSVYYTPGTGYQDSVASATRLLAYRPSLLKQFDWNNGKAMSGDLVDFYRSGGGVDLVTNANDPYYAFSMATRYMEPSGRSASSNSAGWALSKAAAQSRTVSEDYQNWTKADLATDANLSAGEQASLRTSSETSNSGVSLQTYSQNVTDVSGATGMSRRSWINTAQNETTPSATEEIWGGVNAAYFSKPAASGTGIGTTVVAEITQLLPNYFNADGTGANTRFVQTSGSADLLGQWRYATSPNVDGASHVFSDDLGRVRFYRANPSTAAASQGFRYVLYDKLGRISESGILVNTGYSDLSAYATLARDANLDQVLANRCKIKEFTYDVDPRDGTLTAYGNWRGKLSKVRYYTGAVADAPTACSGHDDTGAYNEIWYQYDDLGRVTTLAETRRQASATASPVFRTSAITRSHGNRVSTLTYPDTDQTGTANAFATGSSQVTYMPDVMGRLYMVCNGAGCTDTDQVYFSIVSNDWRGLVTLTYKANGNITTSNSYDLRGALLMTQTAKTAESSSIVMFREKLRYLQTATGDNPCAGNPTTSPNWSGGMLIARQLDGTGLPSADQGVWDCYTYDGAGRQVGTVSSKLSGSSWQGVSSYGYTYDPNGNLTSYTKSTIVGSATAAASKGGLKATADAGKAKASKPASVTRPAVPVKPAAPVKSIKPAAAVSNGKRDLVASASGSAVTASFTRSGSDQIMVASLPDIGDVTPTYDATYGYVTALSGDVQSDLGNSYALSYGHDAFTGKQLTQTLVQTTGTDVKTTLLNATSSYDALGRRINRTVDGGQLSPTSGSTDYWYGPMLLQPLVVTRSEGALETTARVIFLGQEALAIDDEGQVADPNYLVTDHLGSTRLVLDASGDTQHSFSYDGEWGKTIVDGQDSAVDVTSLSTLFRFQGIEQETFPLTALGIDNAEALAWLDGTGQYHYFGREYAAGLAAFLAIDPAGSGASPYSAFGGNPANMIDPDGMAPKSSITAKKFWHQQLRRAAIHFGMEMLWVACAVFNMHVPAAEGGTLNGNGGQLTGVLWPINRIIFRTVFHVMFEGFGQFINRDAIAGYEMLLQGATESLQAYLFNRWLASVPPSDLTRNFGYFYSAVLATEGLMQILELSIQAAQLFWRTRSGSYNFMSNTLFVSFDMVADNPAPPSHTKRALARFHSSLATGLFYGLVYFSAAHLASVFIADDADMESVHTRRWLAFAGFFYVLRNFIGYYQLSMLRESSWSCSRSSNHPQNIRSVHRVNDAIPLPGPAPSQPQNAVVIPVLNTTQQLIPGISQAFDEPRDTSILLTIGGNQNANDLNIIEEGDDEEKKEFETSTSLAYPNYEKNCSHYRNRK